MSTERTRTDGQQGSESQSCHRATDRIGKTANLVPSEHSVANMQR
jgi:hypothetical protein